MLYVLYAIFFISCVVLVGSVLLQPGKTDAGALFTSNVSSTAFSPRGTASVLSKITIAAAVLFMLSALLISFPALSGNQSVLQTTAEAPGEVPANTANTASTGAPDQKTVETQVDPGSVKTITIPADANSSNSVVVGGAPPANPGNAAPPQAPPSNK